MEVAGQGDGQGTRRLFHPDTQCIFIHGLDFVDLLVVGTDPRLDLGVKDAVEIPLRRLRIEICAVVELSRLPRRWKT